MGSSNNWLEEQTFRQMQEQQNKLELQQKQLESQKKAEEEELNKKKLKSLQLLSGGSGLANPPTNQSILG